MLIFHYFIHAIMRCFVFFSVVLFIFNWILFLFNNCDYIFENDCLCKLICLLWFIRCMCCIFNILRLIALTSQYLSNRCLYSRKKLYILHKLILVQLHWVDFNVFRGRFMRPGAGASVWGNPDSGVHVRTQIVQVRI